MTMKKSIIAFPRIGSNRELKFALEKYFRKEITEEELQTVAKEIRLENWKSQKEAGIDSPNLRSINCSWCNSRVL